MNAEAVDRVTLQALHEDLGSEDAVTEELIATFLEEAPVHVAAMRAALDAGDTHDLSRRAHTLKGAAATFGARALADACSSLEDAIHDGRRKDQARLVERIERDYAPVRQALLAWRVS